MKLWHWIPQHLKVSTPVLLAFGFVFFIFHRPQLAPADNEGVSWFPKTSCEDLWQGKDKASYNFVSDSQTQENVEGNSGYSTYLQRLKDQEGILRNQCYKKWTVLVYMTADEELYPYAMLDLIEMEAKYSLPRAASTLYSDLVVNLQTQQHRGSQRLHMFQSNKAFNKDTSNKQSLSLQDIHSPIVSRLNDEELSHEQRLTDFVEWAVTHYPAENYMLIIWGHGRGWSADPQIRGRETQPPRFTFEKQKEDLISVPALARVLARAHQHTFEGQDGIDVFASDACLMQQLEVAYEISADTRYILGSSQTESFMGFPYRRMMYEINRGCFNTRLKQDPYCGNDVGRRDRRGPTQKLKRLCGHDEACYLAQMLPKLFMQSFSKPSHSLQYPGDPKAIERLTMSSINAATLRQGLTHFLYELGLNLETFFKKATFEQREEFIALLNDLKTYYSETHEVSITLQQMNSYFAKYENHKIQNILSDFDDWFSQVVVAQALGQEYIEDQSYTLSPKAVSVWLPTNWESLHLRQDDYSQSQLYKDLNWMAAGQNPWLAWMQELYFPSDPPPLSSSNFVMLVLPHDGEDVGTH